MQNSTNLTIGNVLLADGFLVFDGKSTPVTKTEQKILHYLADREGTSVPQTDILRMLYPQTDLTRCMQRSLDVHICHLRSKLKNSGVTISKGYGFGIKLFITENEPA